jgi:hypothetical protein
MVSFSWCFPAVVQRNTCAGEIKRFSFVKRKSLIKNELRLFRPAETSEAILTIGTASVAETQRMFSQSNAVNTLSST